MIVGYFSYDFRKHAMGFLTRGFLEHHDRARVRPIAYSYGPNDGSDQRMRLMEAVGGATYWRDISNATGELTARLVRQDGVHIAIDLMAHTTGSRQEVMATQPAPVSVQYLGYPSTMGATYVNIVIVDKIVAPPEHRSHFSEQLVILPQTYQSNDYPLDSAIQCPSIDVISNEVVRRHMMGLVKKYGSDATIKNNNNNKTTFHFVSFNKITKLTPKAFRTFARILRRVPRSTLTILSPKYESVKRRLQMELYAQGVEKSRLVFAPMIPRDEHLRRVAQSADLFLDTFVYNAHTTATDALWSGTPVLTLEGPDFAARVATSHVNQMGLKILSTSSLREFEDLAVRIATSPKLLKGLRRRLCKNMWSSALFDTRLTTRRLEQAYEALWDVYMFDRERENDVAGTKHVVVAAGTEPRSLNERLNEILDLLGSGTLGENRTRNILSRLKQTL